MEKLTQTWGERFAREAKGLVARHQPHTPALQWLGPFVRRVSPRPPPPKRYARVEPTELRNVQVDEGNLIPVDVRERLRDIVGPAIDQARVHTGPAADAFARARGADAVTIGNEILFRDGHYQPHDPHGFALLAHEGIHVAAAASSSAMRSTDAGIAEEEARARFVEVGALAHPAFTPNRRSPRPSPSFAPLDAPAPARGNTGGTQPALAATPMAAASDRTTSAPASQPSFDVNELKRSIYRELLQTIRSDSERGG